MAGETGNTISLKLRETTLKFQQEIWSLRSQRARRKCRQVTVTTVDNRKFVIFTPKPEILIFLKL